MDEETGEAAGASPDPVAAGGAAAIATGGPAAVRAGGPVPRPVGLPGCRLCPVRHLRRPDVCLACLEASPGQALPAGGRRCPSCEQLVGGPGACPTRWCGRRDRGWSVVFAAGTYAGGLRRAILRYKYAGERWWAGVLARLLAGYLDRRAPWLEDFDVIVPVPAYTGPGARRTWDPVGEVAAALADLVGAAWPIEADVVAKAVETPPMSGRSSAARGRTAATSLRSALAVRRPAAVAGARVLVLDDVLAEGSTLREVALALRRSGATEVAGLVLARPDWRAARPSRPVGR